MLMLGHTVARGFGEGCADARVHRCVERPLASDLSTPNARPLTPEARTTSCRTSLWNQSRCLASKQVYAPLGRKALNPKAKSDAREVGGVIAFWSTLRCDAVIGGGSMNVRSSARAALLLHPLLQSKHSCCTNITIIQPMTLS